MEKGKSMFWKWILSFISLSTALVLAGLLIGVIAIAAITSGQGSTINEQGQGRSLPTQVEAYRSLMIEICAEYGLSGYEDILLAIMAVESGGNGKDPMNASNSSFNEDYPNDIQDPEYSIRVGVLTFQYLKDLAGLSNFGDFQRILTVIQSYNFGGSYITWLQNHPDKLYTQENAKEFSEMRAAENGTYTYGDPNYIYRISIYWQPANLPEDNPFGWAHGSGPSSGSGIFLWPVPGVFTLSRGFGTQPSGYWHRGIDITAGGILGKPIVAADSGIVTISMYNHTLYGNYVQIDHGNGYKTIYAHCTSLTVFKGRMVSAGEVIGYVGSTGNSTGPHLHFEVLYNGMLIDPFSVL